MKETFTFAHISDLHFGSFSVSPFQFFSKRWLGNFNYLLCRKRRFCYNSLLELIDHLKEQGVTDVFITGDISVTARNIEFSMAKNFLNLLQEKGLNTYVIPGNHDHYTKMSERRKSFYRYFPSTFDANSPHNLREHRVTQKQIKNRLWLVAIDTAFATSWISSEGIFTPEIEEQLVQALDSIPKDDHIILMNHFPFFQNDHSKKLLNRGDVLKNLLTKYPNIVLFLHGHTHRQVVADLRQNNLPIISDSGSTPLVKWGACHLFQWKDNTLSLQVLRYDDAWKEETTHEFSLS